MAGVDNYGLSTEGHEPLARYCICIVDIPVDELRDDICCPACDEARTLLALDPDFPDFPTQSGAPQ